MCNEKDSRDLIFVQFSQREKSTQQFVRESVKNEPLFGLTFKIDINEMKNIQFGFAKEGRENSAGAHLRQPLIHLWTTGMEQI